MSNYDNARESGSDREPEEVHGTSPSGGNGPPDISEQPEVRSTLASAFERNERVRSDRRPSPTPGREPPPLFIPAPRSRPLSRGRSGTSTSAEGGITQISIEEAGRLEAASRPVIGRRRTSITISRSYATWKKK
jgi:hypothetical protein